MFNDNKMILPMLVSISIKHAGHLYFRLSYMHVYMRVLRDKFDCNFEDWNKNSDFFLSREILNGLTKILKKKTLLSQPDEELTHGMTQFYFGYKLQISVLLRHLVPVLQNLYSSSTYGIKVARDGSIPPN